LIINLQVQICKPFDIFKTENTWIEWYIKERKMSFSERWSAFWGDEVDKALAGKDFVIVILKDNYNEYAY